ncbi:MAG: extracellular solute-binding protein [Treponema sp.]|jgi:putative aldouronate transport system substrate-binding protein|nr:extracellular solute-binding protein [Treponema sp.]
MKRYRIALLLVAGFVVLPALVFAGGRQAGSAASGTASSDAAGLQALGFKETGFPIVSQPYTLKVMIGSATGYANRDSDDTEIARKLESQTGIHIEWERAGNDWATQKALVLASGALPDVFWAQLLDSNDINLNSDLFVPMNDLIDKYGANLKAIFAQDTFFAKVGRETNGLIYGLPYKLPDYMPERHVSFINQQWLDTLKLGMPTTTEEFYQALKAFKTGDPNGNGKADEIPMTVTGLWGDASLIDFFYAFGVRPSYGAVEKIMVTDGKVQHIAAHPGFKDAIAWFHKLYSEGLLDQEMFTQGNTVRSAKTNPTEPPALVGVSVDTWLRTSGIVEQWSMLRPLKGPKGDYGWRITPNDLQIRKYGAEISSSTKHPEIAFRWLDNLYDQDISLQVFYGAFGPPLVKNNDGTYTRKSAPANFPGNWTYAYGYNTGAPQYTSAAVDAKIISESSAVPPKNPILLTNYKRDIYMPYETPTYSTHIPFTDEESRELSVLVTDIDTVITQQAAVWVTAGGVEKEYDAFIQRLNGMGLPRLVQIYQTAYDRFQQN